MKDFFKKASKRLTRILFFFSLLALSLLLLRFNYPLPTKVLFFFDILSYLLMFLYVIQAICLFLALGLRIFQSYELIVKVVILGALMITYRQPSVAAGLIIMEEALRAFNHWMQQASVHQVFERLRTQPALLLSTSFAATIAVGTILLSLPIATTGKQIDFFDALFTATSAVCVTGLTVQDTGTYFTFFGQGVILALIQLGGLGIMTLSTSVALIIGRRLSIRERLFMQNVIEEVDYQEFASILRNIFKMTFFIEAIGALFLTFRWYSDFNNFGKALYYGIFHSVAAFCNAGFALFPNNLESYQTDPIINLTITFLITLGGLGFAVIYGTYYFFQSPKPRRMNLHIKTTLAVSTILTFGCALFILLVEYSDSMLGFPLTQKLWISWFQSVTLRTAGFNTFNLSQLSSATLFLFMILMFIGASPGSTGGGIKTTTVGVLFFTVRSMIAGREDVEGFDRSIPWDIVRKSISITFVAGTIVSLGVLALSMTENTPFENILFEVTSAFGTVGLSLGITSQLSSAGKLIITILMYTGRIGPLTVAFLIGTHKSTRGYNLPLGKIVVG